MPTLSNPRKLLLALLCLVVAALNAGGSGGIRFDDGTEDGSGFGGTGKAPTEGGGFGGTGHKPFLGDAGGMRTRFESDLTAITVEVAETEIKRLPRASGVLPPPAVVTAPELAAAHPAEISITDSIQRRLLRDAVIYERILESVENAYPLELNRESWRPPAPEPEAARPRTGAEHRAGAVDVADGEPAAARITWAELAEYLADNAAAGTKDDALTSETLEKRAVAQRPDRIRRPELPQVQRGRVIQRPAILPPRVQPMRF